MFAPQVSFHNIKNKITQAQNNPKRIKKQIQKNKNSSYLNYHSKRRTCPKCLMTNSSDNKTTPEPSDLSK